MASKISRSLHNRTNIGAAPTLASIQISRISYYSFGNVCYRRGNNDFKASLSVEPVQASRLDGCNIILIKWPHSVQFFVYLTLI